jgi:hypothetical protein
MFLISFLTVLYVNLFFDRTGFTHSIADMNHSPKTIRTNVFGIFLKLLYVNIFYLGDLTGQVSPIVADNEPFSVKYSQASLFLFLTADNSNYFFHKCLL